MIVSAAGLVFSLRDPGMEGSLGDRAAFAHLFLAGEYDFLLSQILPGDRVVDAGANIGCFSLLASRRVGPSGIVIAVEPEPSNVRCLRDNIRRNDISNVIVVERALDGISDRTVNIVGTGTTACLEEDGTWVQLWDPTAGTSRTSVKTITLDGVVKELALDRLDAIKMDIEGAERSVFAQRSTSSVLGVARIIAVEVHDRDVPALVQGRLRSEGYGHIGEVKPQSGFLGSSIRQAIRQPSLVLRLYGREVISVAARMFSDALTARTGSDSDLLGMVYAARQSSRPARPEINPP